MGTARQQIIVVIENVLKGTPQATILGQALRDLDSAAEKVQQVGREI